MNRFKRKRLAAMVTGHSLQLKGGEVVVICGPPIAYPMIDELIRHCTRQGARFLVCNRGDLFREAHVPDDVVNASLFYNPLAITAGTVIDCTVGIWARDEPATSPEIAPKKVPEFDPAIEQALQRQFLNRAASGNIRWTAIFYPTKAAARLAGMTEMAFERMVLRAGMLSQRNPIAKWQRIGTQQRLMCERLSAASQMRFVCSLGTDLRVQIEGRRWISCAARNNVPDGEVFTAPVEDGIDGVLVSDIATMHDGHRISGLRLAFEGGRVTDASASEGEQTLIDLLSTDAGSSTVAEIAIGTNFELYRPTQISLLDEKMGGTFHLAFGAAYPETGGTNDSSIHRDFVVDLRRGGTIEVDNRPIMEDGAFVSPEWPS